LSIKYGFNEEITLELININLKRKEEMIMDLVLLQQTNEKEMYEKNIKRENISDLKYKIEKISSKYGINEKKVASLLMDYVMLRNMTN
jgi:hypothetical protein